LIVIFILMVVFIFVFVLFVVRLLATGGNHGIRAGLFFLPNPIACHRVQNGTASPSEKCRASRHHRTERIGKTMPKMEGTLSMLCETSEECLKRRSDLSVEDGIDVLSNGGKPIDFATESCPAEIVFFHYIFFPISGLFISAMCFHHAAKAVSQQRSVRQPD